MGRLLLCATAITLAACGSTSPDEITDTPVLGSVTFDYTGAGSTTVRPFNAVGEVSLTNPVWSTTPMAVAQAQSGNPIFTLVLGASPKASSVWDQILLRVTRVTVGTTTIKTTCIPLTICGGTGIQFELDANHAYTTTVSAYVCGILDGSITITTISDRHVTGTFSGTGVCNAGNNAQTPFSVANGAFDVGIIVSGKPIPKG